MTLWVWFLKLISGFFPVDGKRIGKLIWVVAICLLVLITYNKFTKPTSSTTTTISNPGNVNMDCSQQVTAAIFKVEDRIVKKEGKIKIKLWKIGTLSLLEW